MALEGTYSNHTVAPRAATYLPTPHATQLVLPLPSKSENEPGAHEMQLALLAAPVPSLRRLSLQRLSLRRLNLRRLPSPLQPIRPQ